MRTVNYEHMKLSADQITGISQVIIYANRHSVTPLTQFHSKHEPTSTLVIRRSPFSRLAGIAVTWT